MTLNTESAFWIKHPRCETCQSWTSFPSQWSPTGLHGLCEKMTFIAQGYEQKAPTKNTAWCEAWEKRD